MSGKQWMIYGAVLVSVPLLLALMFCGFVVLNFSCGTMYKPVRFGGPGHSVAFAAERNWLAYSGSVVITSGKLRHAATLNAAQWNCLIATWNQARAEKEASPPSTNMVTSLAVFATAKPTLRIVLRRGSSCWGYKVPASEIGGINQALLQVRDGFHGHIIVPGKSPGLLLGLRAGFGALGSWLFPTAQRPVRVDC